MLFQIVITIIQLIALVIITKQLIEMQKIKKENEEIEKRKNQEKITMEKVVIKENVENPLNLKAENNEKENVKVVEKIIEIKQENKSKLDEIFEKFNSISEEEKNKIEVILNSKKGKEIFLGLGLQPGNFKLLWEHIEFNLKTKNKIEETKILMEVFNYLFETYNLMYEKPVYFYLEDNKNEKYDPLINIPIENSNLDIVEETIFKGYKNRKNEIIKKSLVKLK